MVLYIGAIIYAQYIIGTMLDTNFFSDNIKVVQIYNWIIIEMAGYYSGIAATIIYVLIN